ncbi:M20/M25/M40 family metallo-hydrolase, partial [Flavobacterium sp.]|uniref:M20/M25/M40 family metallo-hydrolase n=1 Tax=Flavobacterium sp. TaxID=239 RepID=UPI00286C960B
EFSTPKAIEHIRNIAQKPHYIGSQNHEVVADYLIQELKKLGLNPQTQEGTTLTEWGNLVKSRNIIARIDGTDTSKALLLLSHYDSAPHSFSCGASDDASGVATILEGLRAFLHQKKPHKNDIVILFSDAEELGLNGAALFVTQHQWAKEIGLALNFEARGTSGPSYMLMEVNQGNSAMVEGFTKANPKYPVSNSLMYSIYKMLPNDTDLTVFREQGKIQGFNFAFIDNHFNYHTAQDNFAHVNPTTIAHQGSYLMPMLGYFSNADLKHLDSTQDDVYFNTPFYFVSYSFAWIMKMAIGALLFFLFLVIIGAGKKILLGKEIAKGFLYLFGALITAGFCNYFGWQLLLKIYPQYQDILQGFTYNGHYYLAAFAFLNLAIAFLFYGNSKTATVNLNQTIAPLFVWILINLAIAIYLPGAGFFIIPVYFGLLMLAYFIITQQTNLALNLILSIPALVIFVPFIIQFPIGLGLKMLTGSAVLTVLVFALLLPIFGSFGKKRFWISTLFILSMVFFGMAHYYSSYEVGKAKPNSLVYVLNADKNRATWATYDQNLDAWTKNYLGENPQKPNAVDGDNLFSKYNSAFTFTAKAPIKNIAKPTIVFLKDSVVGNQRLLKIRISPNRKVNRYDIFADEKMAIYNLKANHVKAITQKGSLYQRTTKRVLSYYVVNNEPLELEFSINAKSILNMNLVESAFDLMNNPLFTMVKRASWMMPMPFVLTDAVVIEQKIKPSERIITPETSITIPTFDLKNDSIVQVVDTIKIK